MLVIYGKSDGYIYMMGHGYPTPIGGLDCIETEIPEGQMLEKIDVSGETPTPVFKDYPKSDVELLQERVKELEDQNKAFVSGIEKLTK